MKLTQDHRSYRYAVWAWYLCLAATFVSTAIAQGDSSPRRTAQVPFVADAVGNALPPPSEVPAKVGSPSDLLTPDRYEFYTFDESGELVKRLMTLEEIQAIVAVGDGNDGHMVTFAQDDKPTIAFNFSQPPFTKVHSVVTNVQNVLKSQMEAQKNNPPNPISFDTPDVSNSWSMILPSIFGNTGVEIVPDKLPSTFGTPETDTIDVGFKPLQGSDIVASKEDLDVDSIESSKDSLSIETKEEQNNEQSASKKTTTTAEATTTTPSTTTTTTTTTPKPTTITTTTTTPKPTTKTTTTTTSTTPKPNTTPKIITTLEPSTTTTTQKPTTSEKNSLTETSTLRVNDLYEKINTSDPVQKLESKKPETKPKKPSGSDKNSHMAPSTTTEMSYIEITKLKLTPKPTTIKQSTTSILNDFPPTRRTTDSIKLTTRTIPPIVSITTYRPITNTYSSTEETPKVSFTLAEFDETKNGNGTTLTTQSVSPSTAHSTTDTISSAKNSTKEDEFQQINAPDKFEQELIPSFDVAQSISQIASDLGNGFLIQNNDGGLEAEVKENSDLDLPDVTTTDKPRITESNSTFVQISTSDPQGIKETYSTIFAKPSTHYTTENVNSVTYSSNIYSNKTEPSTQVDAVLSEAMSDLISQVVDQLPNNMVQTTTINNLNSITEIPFKTNDSTEAITATSNTSVDSIGMKTNETAVDNNTKISNLNISTNINKTELNISQSILLNNDEILSSPTPNNFSTSSAKDGNKIAPNGNIEKIIHSTSTKINAEVSTQMPTVTQSSTDFPIPILNNRIRTENESSLQNDKTFEVYNKTDIKNDFQKLQNQITNITSDNAKNESILTNNAINKISQKQPQKVNESKKKIQKVNFEDKEFTDLIKNNSWKLVSTVSPPRGDDIPISNDQSKSEGGSIPPIPEFTNELSNKINLNGSNENQGLQVTVKNLGEDVYQFIDLCNELAFRYWSAAVENIDKKRGFILSPYSITSMLAMMFMGARGATSGEMNEILKLDDMVTFNPHFTLKNISDSIETNPESGVAVSAFVRELYSDRNQGKLLTFYKERAQHFYNGHVEEINFKLINDIIRRRTNLLVKRYTWGKINEYIKTNDIMMKPPLAAFSANIFQTDCTGSSVEGRDGEMYFVVSPSVRQRRLVPVPAVVYRAGFLAGYDPVLDATAAAVGTTSSVVSIILLMPGQQGNTVHADDLEKLEKKLLDSIPTTPEWYRLMRTLLPRPGLELQIPRFSHRSIFNVSSALRGMGLRDIFDSAKADLGGLNGPSKDLYLSDMVETSTFVTCGEGPVGEQHHVEEYPEMGDVGRKRRNSRFWDEPRDYQRSFHDPHDLGAALLPLHLRPRQARLPSRSAPPQPARLKFDRPFLYFVRHNPSGMILYVGRYNPRLLP